MEDERSSGLNANNEIEMLRRYAEHTLDIPAASVRMLALPLIDRTGPLPHDIHHGLVVNLINQAVVSAETLAALVYCFSHRGSASPSFWKSLVTYQQWYPRKLWAQVAKNGWDRSQLALPPSTDLSRAVDDARATMAKEPNAGTTTVERGLALPWEDFDAVINETAWNISNDSNKIYRMGMKAKHGMCFTWSYVKDHGSSLCFVDGETLDVWNVPVDPDFASTLQRFSLNALGAAQKLASIAWALARADQLYAGAEQATEPDCSGD